MNFSIFFNIFGVNKYYIPLGFHFKLIKNKSNLIDRENIILPSVKIEHFDTEIDYALKPCFDALWNACGQHFSKVFNRDYPILRYEDRFSFIKHLNL